MRKVVATLVVALSVAACTAGGGEGPGLGPGPARVDVDTGALREAKADLGMEDCPATSGDGAVEGGLPDLTLPCLGGGRDVDLAALRGPVVINLWQSFCGPCREEMPALQEFHRRYGDQVPVLGVDYQDTRPGAALELAEQTGATYPSVADPGGELNGAPGLTGLRGVPVFVLVDEEGRIAQVLPGGVDEVDDVVAMVEDHLGVQL